MARPVEASIAHISAAHCPANLSHGLYALHSDLKPDPAIDRTNDLVAKDHGGEVCASLQPPIPRTHVCVHPPQRDTIISKGVIWRGHWASDCNDIYRIKTLCRMVAAVRQSGLGARAWCSTSAQTSARSRCRSSRRVSM